MEYTSEAATSNKVPNSNVPVNTMLSECHYDGKEYVAIQYTINDIL